MRSERWRRGCLPSATRHHELRMATNAPRSRPTALSPRRRVYERPRSGPRRARRHRAQPRRRPVPPPPPALATASRSPTTAPTQSIEFDHERGADPSVRREDALDDGDEHAEGERGHTVEERHDTRPSRYPSDDVCDDTDEKGGKVARGLLGTDVGKDE